MMFYAVIRNKHNARRSGGSVDLIRFIMALRVRKTLSIPFCFANSKPRRSGSETLIMH